MDDLGERLAGRYYARALYQPAQRVCQAVAEKMKPLPFWCSNQLGMIYFSTGNYAPALPCFQAALEAFERLEKPDGSDFKDLGTTLNNISQIYDARGDYATALSYLERSLKISQEIGDKSGQIPTLHNMAQIAWNQDNFEKYLKLEMQAYQLAIETQDAMGLFQVGQDLGDVLCQMGQKAQGLPLLQQAYQIGQAAGLPGTEQIKELIEKFS